MLCKNKCLSDFKCVKGKERQRKHNMNILEGNLKLEYSRKKIRNEWRNTEFIRHFLMLLYVCKRSETFSQIIYFKLQIRTLFRIFLTALNGPYLSITEKLKTDFVWVTKKQKKAYLKKKKRNNFLNILIFWCSNKHVCYPVFHFN